MSKLVELVTAWDKFNREHAEQSVEQFCRHYLARQQAPQPETKQDRKQKTGGLLKLMGRITSAFALYHRAAMTQTALPNAESFYYLNGLNFLGEARKTELINYLFAEYTTGMEAIGKLIEAEYITEKPDPTDKRAKLIKLTKKGLKQLHESYSYSSKAGEMIFDDVSSDTIMLCQALLKPIEERHTKLLPSLKNKDFDAMYHQVTGKKIKEGKAQKDD
ncbi:MAG TPA: winged helix DNA-binding protein [Mucilaginibacter sp.]|jgi:DNA-binding MarR family transcriptional regulator